MAFIEPGQEPVADRAAFERHAERLGYSVDPDTREGREGGYWSSHTQLMWLTWQAALAQPEQEPEWEVRADGKRVHKDRWQIGIRRIVALIWGNRREFEIDEVVEAVRGLASAERTLKRLGYTDCGGEFWKPPLGAPPQRKPVQEPDSPERRCGGPGCDLKCCQPVQEPGHGIGGEG